ncbi:PAS domain-containing protein [Salegentibacter sp. F188]|uniref:PAS domain-containing protein n=1 Tax=Autumnicola patrickiae TaxID=3075591 RepID=A0ABU3E231_9FLAO|nr:PAS domain-containing protein [Salegentibacter sp. F188]MDT0690016.1 PAS domain-containing protein [Salegentibacter sp. F188]
MSRYQDDLSNMRSLDLYLQTLSDKEYRKIKSKINSHRLATAPLAGMDISSTSFHSALNRKRKERELKSLKQFQKRFEWQFDINSVLDEEYDALVLTDATRVINWVSKGFYEMTGYAASFAIGRTPDFLQGQNTPEEIKKRVSRKLKEEIIFTETFTNYRKNNEEYLCEITIIPLRSYGTELTHFLALEREVAA